MTCTLADEIPPFPSNTIGSLELGDNRMDQESRKLGINVFCSGEEHIEKRFCPGRGK